MSSHRSSPFERQSINQKNMFPNSIKSCIVQAQGSTDAKVKFQILETIIDDFSQSSELTEFFTELLSEIFGYGDYSGWRLNTLDAKSHSDEVLYKKVYNFLHPFGHMFKLIKKLDNENVAIDFPTSAAGSSGPVQRSLIQSFCQQRLGVAAGNQIISSIKLSAFEYYLFMYFYYILHPKVQKGQLDWSRHSDILYVALFEEYLAYFLPANNPQTFQSNVQATSSSHFSLYDHNLSTRASDSLLNSNQRFPSSVQHASNSLTGIKAIISNTGLNSLRRMTWKSEVFVQMLSDFWLGQGNEISTSDNTEYALPTVDQTLMIRIFIKHMHYFLNSEEKTNIHNLAYQGTTIESQTEEFKRVILPTIVNKKLYLFLKNCFSHWPLDPSFKMVLETWLSYIQPWRYKDLGNTDNNTSKDQSDLENWRSFIGDKLLFYTVFIRMFVSRIGRFDLQCLKDIQIIQRFTKVFSQGNLAQIIQEVEGEFIASSGYTNIHRFSTTRLGSSFSNLRPHSKEIDLEEPEFQYEPIFSRTFINKIEYLAQTFFNESENLKQELTAKSKSVPKGMVSKLKAFFTVDQSDEDDTDDARIVEYLDRICTDLADIFDFIPPKSSKISFGNGDTSNANQLPKPFSADKCYEDGVLLPEHVIGSDGKVSLTEKGKHQIIQQLRHFKIQGKVSRDLQPVRSYEIHFLVRWMYALSLLLNAKLRRPITQLYNRKDVVGKTLRKLSPNVSGQYGLAVKLPDTVQLGSLQPKISLRFLSSYYTIYYIGWLLLISKLFGLGLLQSLLLFVLIFILFTLQHMDSYTERSAGSIQ